MSPETDNKVAVNYVLTYNRNRSVEDLTGAVFGNRRVLWLDGIDTKGSRWAMQCIDCGALSVVGRPQLRVGYDCAFCRVRPPRRDLTGYLNGKLTAIGASIIPGQSIKWVCRCACGNYIERTASQLTNTKWKKNQACSQGCAAAFVLDPASLPLGEEPDEWIARRLGCSKTPIVKARRVLGIAASRKLRYRYKGTCPCGKQFDRVSAAPVKYCGRSKNCTYQKGVAAAMHYFSSTALRETAISLARLNHKIREVSNGAA